MEIPEPKVVAADPAIEAAEVEEAEWAPLTRQVSGVRGMHVL